MKNGGKGPGTGPRSRFWLRSGVAGATWRSQTNEEAVQLLVSAIERAGYTPGDQIAIALDAASSEFYRDGIWMAPVAKSRMSSSSSER